jgi:glycosyltransferase involved in cell wall biosynthesis
MNLVIDCFKQVKGAGKSIGIYNLAKSITCHLGERALEEAKRKGDAGGKVGRKNGGDSDTIIVLGNAHNREEFDVPGVVFVEVKGNPLNKLYCIFWELFLVRKYAKRYQADRVLFPRGYRPIGRKGSIGIRKGGRKIKDTILIHDLIPFYYDKHYPGFFNRLENAYIMYRLKVSMKKADRIITISGYSKEDILDKAPLCGKKIKIIHNGLNDVSYHTEKGKGAAEKGEGDYIVAMTSGLPHKNAKGVLRAYEAYYKKASQPLRLVVIGIEGISFYKEMEPEAAAHVECHKFFQGFDEVCRVVAGAKAYLFLSYVEGFGFPPLEAMQMGVPVVCSDRSSLPEVVGDAGILVNPDDMEEAAKALIRVTEEDEVREGLIKRGYENIKRFSWESRTDLYWEELFR